MLSKAGREGAAEEKWFDEVRDAKQNSDGSRKTFRVTVTYRVAVLGLAVIKLAELDRLETTFRVCIEYNCIRLASIRKTRAVHMRKKL
jgi:hypothetical protein